MKSRITDEKYQNYQIEQEYNKIVFSCANYMIANALRDNKKRLILKEVNSYYLPCALSIAHAALCLNNDLNRNIYLECKLKDYFKIKKKYKNFSLKWTRPTHLCATGYVSLYSMISEQHKVNDPLIFEKIYEKFYNVENSEGNKEDEDN